MKKIMITGALGQLGRALTRLYEGREDVCLYRYDTREEDGVSVLDITREEDVKEAVKKTAPDVVINCSAFTDVNRCETEEELAERVNGDGPGILARAAREAGAVLVHISTDYVFDGCGTRPYRETDPVGPVSAYGRTKRKGELEVQKEADRYFIIRTAWLYGEGKNFVRTMLRLAQEKEEIGVVCDQRGTPTSAGELAKMIEYLLTTEAYGIYHGTCEGETTWYEFAREIFRLKHKSVKVKPLTTEEYPTPARRPAYSVLENVRLKELGGFQMADWKEALARYLAEEERG